MGIIVDPSGLYSENLARKERRARKIDTDRRHHRTTEVSRSKTSGDNRLDVDYMPDEFSFFRDRAKQPRMPRDRFWEPRTMVVKKGLDPHPVFYGIKLAHSEIPYIDAVMGKTTGLGFNRDHINVQTFSFMLEVMPTDALEILAQEGLLEEADSKWYGSHSEK